MGITTIHRDALQRAISAYSQPAPFILDELDRMPVEFVNGGIDAVNREMRLTSEQFEQLKEEYRNRLYIPRVWERKSVDFTKIETDFGAVTIVVDGE